MNELFESELSFMGLMTKKMMEKKKKSKPRKKNSIILKILG